MATTLRNRLFTLHSTSPRPSRNASSSSLSLKTPPLLQPTHCGPSFRTSTSKIENPTASDSAWIVRKVFLLLHGVDNGKPEYAIRGPSIVGRSSHINALARTSEEVAVTSKEPGKTQLINHFLVNKSW
ncbi:hypothetical protein BT93_L2366 [Corymbia citriodora subsp. variegata]|uniref:Uncharacterized protein n=1 Tax=Corymbia citriodora subsp. variegata TaxID=360336 RepID=A0A8T0CMJ0_CORYI|nr:hypothetical protein BT93_L2366 [Corymbia citriodora subsp. variegata]